MTLLEGDDRLRDEARVPLLHRIGRGRQPAVRLREPRVAVERFAQRREVDLRGRRPLVAEQRFHVADRTGDARHDRIPVLGVADREAQHLRERQRAVVAQQRDPAAEGARDDGGQRARPGHEIEPELVAIALDRRRLRRRALRAQDERLATRRRPEDRGQVSAGAVQVRLDDLQREAGCNGGVERVAALLEHGHSRSGREPVRRRDHAEGAAKLGARGEHARGR